MPALTPFIDRLMTDAALPTTIRRALGIDDEDHAAIAYNGRRPRAVRSPLEVFVEDDETLPQGGGGASDRTEHRLLLHVTFRSLGSGDRTGRTQLEAMRGYCRALVAALDCQRLWLDVIGTDVMCSTAEIRSVDEDKEAVTGIEGVVALSVVTRGSGEVDGLESPGG